MIELCRENDQSVSCLGGGRDHALKLFLSLSDDTELVSTVCGHNIVCNDGDLEGDEVVKAHQKEVQVIFSGRASRWQNPREEVSNCAEPIVFELAGRNQGNENSMQLLQPQDNAHVVVGDKFRQDTSASGRSSHHQREECVHQSTEDRLVELTFANSLEQPRHTTEMPKYPGNWKSARNRILQKLIARSTSSTCAPTDRQLTFLADQLAIALDHGTLSAVPELLNELLPSTTSALSSFLRNSWSGIENDCIMLNSSSGGSGYRIQRDEDCVDGMDGASETLLGPTESTHTESNPRVLFEPSQGDDASSEVDPGPALNRRGILRHCPVDCISLDTGEVISSFPSITDAAKFTAPELGREIRSAIVCICGCCKGRTMSALGYGWQYSTTNNTDEVQANQKKSRPTVRASGLRNPSFESSEHALEKSGSNKSKQKEFKPSLPLESEGGQASSELDPGPAVSKRGGSRLCPVDCISLVTGDLIKSFSSIATAGKFAASDKGLKYSNPSSTIWSCCKGRSHSAFGYGWRYSSDTNDTDGVQQEQLLRPLPCAWLARSPIDVGELVNVAQAPTLTVCRESDCRVLLEPTEGGQPTSKLLEFNFTNSQQQPGHLTIFLDDRIRVRNKILENLLARSSSSSNALASVTQSTHVANQLERALLHVSKTRDDYTSFFNFPRLIKELAASIRVSNDFTVARQVMDQYALDPTLSFSFSSIPAADLFETEDELTLLDPSLPSRDDFVDGMGAVARSVLPSIACSVQMTDDCISQLPGEKDGLIHIPASCLGANHILNWGEQDMNGWVDNQSHGHSETRESQKGAEENQYNQDACSNEVMEVGAFIYEISLPAKRPAMRLGMYSCRHITGSVSLINCEQSSRNIEATTALQVASKVPEVREIIYSSEEMSSCLDYFGNAICGTGMGDKLIGIDDTLLFGMSFSAIRAMQVEAVDCPVTLTFMRLKIVEENAAEALKPTDAESEESDRSLSQEPSEASPGPIALNRESMSAGRRRNSDKCRPVDCISLETNEVIQSFPSITAAANIEASRQGRNINSTKNLISHCLKGRTQVALGYAWRFSVVGDTDGVQQQQHQQWSLPPGTWQSRSPAAAAAISNRAVEDPLGLTQAKRRKTNRRLAQEHFEGAHTSQELDPESAVRKRSGSCLPRPVDCISLDTGDTIKSFPTLTTAAKFAVSDSSKSINACIAAICNCCRGRSYAALGFMWRYSEPTTDTDDADGVQSERPRRNTALGKRGRSPAKKAAALQQAATHESVHTTFTEDIQLKPATASGIMSRAIVRLDTNLLRCLLCDRQSAHCSTHTFFLHPYVTKTYEGQPLVACGPCLRNWKEEREIAERQGKLMLAGKVNEELCCFCSQSPGDDDLLVCDRCPRSYCRGCLQRVVSPAEMRGIEADDGVEWQCFGCIGDQDRCDLNTPDLSARAWIQAVGKPSQPQAGPEEYEPQSLEKSTERNSPGRSFRCSEDICCKVKGNDWPEPLRKRSKGSVIASQPMEEHSEIGGAAVDCEYNDCDRRDDSCNDSDRDGHGDDDAIQQTRDCIALEDGDNHDDNDNYEDGDDDNDDELAHKARKLLVERLHVGCEIFAWPTATSSNARPARVVAVKEAANEVLVRWDGFKSIVRLPLQASQFKFRRLV